MSLSLELSSADRKRARPQDRFLALVALMPAEALAVSFYFDGDALRGSSDALSALASHASGAARVAASAAVATLLFGGKDLRDGFRDLLAGRPGSARRDLPVLAAHLACFAAFVGLTVAIQSDGFRSSPRPGAWVAAWLAAGLVTLLSWILVVLPLRLWIILARTAPVALISGAAVGLSSHVAGGFVAKLWGPLGDSTFWAVRHLLGLVHGSVSYSAADRVIGTPEFQVEIAPQCSGYEGIGLIWVFLAAYLWFFRDGIRPARALLLFPIGTVLMWSANAVRISALISLGTWWSPEVALGGFHSQAGWLGFNAVGLGLVVAARRHRFFAADHPSEGAPVGSNPAAPYLMPLLALLVTTMATGAFTSGFDAGYPLRVAAVASALWFYRGEYRWIGLTGSWSAAALGAGVFVLWMALEPAASGDSLTAGLASLPTPWAVAWLAARALGSSVTVPLAEELAFRGYLSRRLIAAEFEDVPPGRFTWPSFLISSAIFGALHGRWFAGTLAGMLYAWAYYRRGRIGDAVVAHAATNALIAAYVLWAGAWSMWT